MGPLGLTPVLALRNAGRDGNVFLDPTNPVEDTSVVVRGSVKGALPVRQRMRLSGEGWLDWSYFSNTTTERSTDPGGQGRAEVDLGRFTLIGGGGAYQARQLYSIDIDERTLRQEHWGYAGGQLAMSKRFTLAAGGEARSIRYDGRVFTGGNFRTALLLNRNAKSANAEARYALTPLTTVVLSATRIDEEYAVANPDLRTTTSYRYLAGFEFGQKALLNGRVLAGIRDFPLGSAGTAPSYRGPAVAADVVLPFRGTGRLVGSLLRDVFLSSTAWTSGSQEFLRNAYVLSSAKGSAEHGLPLDLLARVSVGYDSAEYLLPETRAGVRFPRVDHLYSAGATLLRAVSGSLRVGGTVTYYRRVSTLPGGSYDRWIYGVSAELAP